MNYINARLTSTIVLDNDKEVERGEQVKILCKVKKYAYASGYGYVVVFNDGYSQTLDIGLVEFDYVPLLELN